MTPVGLSWTQWVMIFVPAVICALCAAAAMICLGAVLQLVRQGHSLAPVPAAAAAPAGTALAVRPPAPAARWRHAAAPPHHGTLARLRRQPDPEPGDPEFWSAPSAELPPRLPSGGPHDTTMVLAAGFSGLQGCPACSGYVCPDCRGCSCPARTCRCSA